MNWCKNCKHWVPFDYNIGTCHGITHTYDTPRHVAHRDEIAIMHVSPASGTPTFMTRSTFICKLYEEKN